MEGRETGERGGEERPGREMDREELLLKEGRHFGEAGARRTGGAESLRSAQQQPSV